MMFIPKEQHEKMQDMTEQRRIEFIEKAKNADFGFSAMVEAIYERPDFDSYPEHEKQFIKDFIEARKIKTV